jgi:hypothetical protein
VCYIDGNPTFEIASDFTLVCSQYSNSLFVQWECVASSDLTTTVPTTTVPSLPYCPENPSGTCQAELGSPIEPEFLTNSTLTSYDYPIYEQVICNGAKMAILCPANLVIHIYSGICDYE